MSKILLTAIIISLFGCANSPKKQNPAITEMLDKCVTMRRLATEFDSKKSIQLTRLECEQILSMNVEFLKIDNGNYRKSRNKVYFSEQLDFNSNTWFLVTEVVRKQHYPDYLDPESEVIRANALAEEQEKTIMDESVRRHWVPRLLPVSPYLMNYDQLVWADNAAADLLLKNKNNDKIRRELTNIRLIIDNEKRNKDPWRIRG